MARNFVSASTQYLEYTGAILTAAPLSFAAWGRPTSFTGSPLAISISGTGSAHYFGLYYNTSGGVTMISRDTTGATATSTANASLNVWSHMCGVTESATSRAAYLNGANKGTNTTSKTPTTLTVTTIGRATRVTPIQYFNGDLAEVAVWNIALTDAEAAILATGVSPLLVRPNNLVAYWPIYGRSSGVEIDAVGRFNQTISGATQAAHPRIYNPNRRKLGIYVAPPASGQPAIKRMGGVKFNAGPFGHAQNVRGW